MSRARSSNQTTINPTAASLLGFLHEGPMTGWELVAAVEGSIGNFWNVTRSQVYRELRSLSQAGMVTAGDRGPRDRLPHELTEAGRRAFAEWITRDPTREIIRYPLLVTIFFAEHVPPERLRRFLAQHQLDHQRRLEEYQSLAETLDNPESGPALALRFGLEYEQAVLRWFDSLPQPL